MVRRRSAVRFRIGAPNGRRPPPTAGAFFRYPSPSQGFSGTGGQNRLQVVRGGAVRSPAEGGQEDRLEVLLGHAGPDVLQHGGKLLVAYDAQMFLAQPADDLDQFGPQTHPVAGGTDL